MSILLSLQAVGAQTAEQMPDLTAVTAPTEAEINVIDLAFKGGWIIAIVADGMLYIYPAPDGHPPRR